jgi:Uma2 family endonuclease
MPAMSSQTSPGEVLKAVEHLPAGALLVIHGFSWDDYENLLEELGDSSHARVSYDSGRLEILSPSGLHGNYEWFINLFVYEFCRALNLKLHGFGHTTWRKKSAAKGVEAGACFYVRTPVTGRKDFSLEMGPPPDICVEVDITRNSLKKLSIYAALGVPESMDL